MDMFVPIEVFFMSRDHGLQVPSSEMFLDMKFIAEESVMVRIRLLLVTRLRREG